MANGSRLNVHSVAPEGGGGFWLTGELHLPAFFFSGFSQGFVDDRVSAGPSAFSRDRCRTSESERSTLIPVRWSQARHQICTVDENPIMERNDEYSKRYVG